MPDKYSKMMPHSDLDYIRGRLDEIEARITMISSRLDTHIAACSTRYFSLISGTIAIGTIILTTLGIFIHYG